MQRDDDTTRWLKRWRDKYEPDRFIDHASAYWAIDAMIDEYTDEEQEI